MYKLACIIQYRTINNKKADKLIIPFDLKLFTINKKGVKKQIFMIFYQIAECFE